MTPGSANFRRANRNPSYQHLPRAEYVQRAVEMAPRGSQLAKKLTSMDVTIIRDNRYGLTDKQQAATFGVSASMVYKIRKGERWGVVR
jgi:DNA-binding transcriptional regulator YiaG